MSRIRGKANADYQKLVGSVAGIDVSKASLDVCLHPSGDRFRVRNDASGLDELQDRCLASSACLVVMEATGRYHRAAHAWLHEAGVPVAAINPYRTRRFAEVLGRLAKTDKIDAEVRRRHETRADEAASETMAWITEIIVARRQVVDERRALENQRAQATLDLVQEQLDERIALCRRQCKILNAELLEAIRSEPAIARRYAILTSIPGIAPTTAATLLSEMKELGSANAAEVAALAGVAPMNRDSGALRGRKMIPSGRIVARNALYMAAVVAVRWNRDLAAFYGRLRDACKPFKVAITAVMRKLLLLANTLLKEGRAWSPTPP